MLASSFHQFPFLAAILRSQKIYWFLGIAVAAGFAVRLIGLSMHSVLLDEATVAIGARDIVQNHTPMWEAMSNAPFVWMIGRLLGMGGLASAFWLRFPSAIFGTASIVLLFFIARRLFEAKIALVSALLFAIHPFAVAFSRVLFADPFQLFFILLGVLAFEQFMELPRAMNRRTWLLLFYIAVVWALAFLMKYNAIVPGAIWLFCGVISGRYKLLPSIALFIAMAIGAFGTLLLWPYDAPVWFFAFLGKAGSYNFYAAINFYRQKLHLILFPIVTEIAFPAAALIAWFLWKKNVPDDEKAQNKKYSKSILQLTFFLLLQTAVLIQLGRIFERYLLVMVPFGCILVIALIGIPVKKIVRWNPYLWNDYRRTGIKTYRPTAHQIIIYLICLLILQFITMGVIAEYRNYRKYLDNDVNEANLAQTVRAAQRADTSVRAFWLSPEPIAAYYLGYTQRYSRATLPDYDAPNSERNYFGFVGVPRSDDWSGDKVLAIRHLMRAVGFFHVLQSPRQFIAEANRLSDSVRHAPPLPVSNYLSDSLVHPGDLLIMQSGFIDLAGEPILEDISHEPGPPYISHLPLSNFTVERVYRPDGPTATTDTTMDPVRAGAWLLSRK